jgi:uncharacterized protein (TIGR03437 family)
LIAFTLVCLSAAAAFAQATPTPTPDSFATQITSSATVNSFVGGISGSGRFVVFESTGDLSTLAPGQTTRTVTNTDGNREIFLYDYAQRRIFQITSTTSARKDATAVAINPATPANFSNIAVEVSNNRPSISRDGRWIVFSSNADTPFNFDGDANKATLTLDGNQEVFLYRIPDAPAVDLRSGVDTGFINLRQNAFTRVTNTAASRVPVAGTATTPPIVADDNRSAQVNDRASRVAFVSTRNLAAKNADANPEIFVWTRTSDTTGAFAQITNTTGAFTFNDNPSISGDTATDDGAEDPRSVLAFISNATVMRDLNDATIATNNADGNGEVFVAAFNGAAASGLTQATRTRRTNQNDIVNVLNPGPRLSRDGRFLAFETVATDPKADTATNQFVRGMYVYVIASDTFIQIGPRGSVADEEEDVLRFPVFTGDSSQLVFVSALNFTAAGARVPPADATGLNTTGFKQIFTVPIPASATAAQSFTRLSNVITGALASLQPFVSNTTERLAFTFNGELGGGNGVVSGELSPTAEVFYLTAPPAAGATSTPAASSALTYFTGASRREVVSPPATPTPTPSPVPAATPITGLAPGMIAVVRAPTTEGGVRFGTATTRVCEPQAVCDAASQSRRRPSLPVELGGVSLSINNAASGLYFVSPTEIQFVVPIGLVTQTGTSTYPVVININEGGAVRSVRSTVQVVSAQPDIFTRSDAPTRASVFNSTNMTLMGEPADGFPVTTDVMGTARPTVLSIFLTGIRNLPVGVISVMIGDRTLTGAAEILSNTPTDMPGVDQLNVQLRPDLAGLGDQPLVVSVNVGGQVFTSRPAATAPRIRIK